VFWDHGRSEGGGKNQENGESYLEALGENQKVNKLPTKKKQHNAGWKRTNTPTAQSKRKVKGIKRKLFMQNGPKACTIKSCSTNEGDN